MFVGMAIITDGCYALLSGTAGNWLKSSPWYLRFQRYFAGSIYVGLGLIAAFSGGSKK
jgi:threonine/homoserine/homoserine lactone efflux protein